MPRLLKALRLALIAAVLPFAAGAAMAADTPARSGLIGFSEAPSKLTIYFSLSCPHCLESIETVHSMVKTLLRERHITVELIEVPGMIGEPPAPEYATKEHKRRAIRNGYQASLVFSCAAGMEPGMSWRRIARFYYALRQTVDPDKFDYLNWVYAEPKHLTAKALEPWPDPSAATSGKMISAYYHSRLQVGWPPHLEMQRCVSDPEQIDTIVKRLDAQFARFQASGFKGVPIYLWNGRRISRSKFEEIMNRDAK